MHEKLLNLFIITKRSTRMANKLVPCKYTGQEQRIRFGGSCHSRALDVVSIVESSISSMPGIQRHMVRSSLRGVAMLESLGLSLKNRYIVFGFLGR